MSSTHHNNDERNGKGRAVGWIITAVVHGVFFYVLFSVWIARAPRADMANLDVEILADMEEPKREELIAVSRQPVPVPQPAAGAKPVPVTPPEQTAPSSIDNTGDVEVPEKPAIDKRSLYQSDDQGAEEASATGENNARTLYKGSSEGRDTNSGGGDDVSTFSLSGRSVEGKLGEPTNTSNKEGRVVVEITVNQVGQVIKAKARTQGSTVLDAVLWKAAEKAAMETLFNTDNNAPIMQVGTITYIFRLR